MNRSIKYTFFFCFLLTICKSQNISLSLYQGGTAFYNHHIYAFGIKDDSQNKYLAIYLLNADLRMKDSLFIKLSKTNIDNYLDLHCDTLHDFLNIYLQEKNSKQANIIRVNKQFKLKAEIKNTDVARINNADVIGLNTLIIKNTVYAVKTANDSSGKQFYLNKYILKSDSLNFDYLLKWQYPFERKHIQSIKILNADTFQISLIVNIYQGTKAGDWLLKIDAKQGKLIKAIKLSDKSENSYLMNGTIYFNSNEKITWFYGQKLNQTQFNPITQNLITTGISNVFVYAIGIDSLGEIIGKQEFKIPVKDIQQGAKKTANTYFLKFTKAMKLNSGKTQLDFDVYKNENGQLCFYYSNTQSLFLNFDGEKYQLENTSISPNIDIENYYRNNDKLNMNGKICIDSLSELNQLYVSKPINQVKIAYKTDDNMNGIWLLSKIDVNKQSLNLSVYKPVNKIYQLKSIENFNSTLGQKVIVCKQNIIITAKQIEKNIFELKLIPW